MRPTHHHDTTPAADVPRRARPPEPIVWGAAFGSSAGQGFAFGAPARRPRTSDWG